LAYNYQQVFVFAMCEGGNRKLMFCPIVVTVYSKYGHLRCIAWYEIIFLKDSDDEFFKNCFAVVVV